MSKFIVVAVCSDDADKWNLRTAGLRQSAEKYDVPLKIFYTGHPHVGNVHLKVRFLRESLQSIVDEHDVVAYLDAFDTFVYDSEESIVSKFEQIGSDVVLSPTAWTYPEYEDRFPEYTKNPYRFFNPGAFVGKTQSLIDMLGKIDDGSFCEFDSALWFEHYVSDPSRYTIDHEGEIFLTSNRERPGHISIGDHISNLFTGNKPSLLHFPATNGDSLLYRRIKKHVIGTGFRFEVGKEKSPMITGMGASLLKPPIFEDNHLVDFDLLKPVEFYIIPQVFKSMAENDRYFVRVEDFFDSNILSLFFFMRDGDVVGRCEVFNDSQEFLFPDEEVRVKYIPESVANNLKKISLEFPFGRIENASSR